MQIISYSFKDEQFIWIVRALFQSLKEDKGKIQEGSVILGVLELQLLVPYDEFEEEFLAEIKDDEWLEVVGWSSAHVVEVKEKYEEAKGLVWIVEVKVLEVNVLALA